MTVDTDNKEFQDALNLIQYTRQSVFLTGKAGTGKSTFLRHICANTKKKYVVLAPTGIAAINAGGSTMHSFFKLPFYPILPDDPNLSLQRGRIHEFFKYAKPHRKLLEQIELVIIDEISMCRIDLFDYVMRMISDAQVSSGRKQVVLVGDFFQLPPVITEDDRAILMKLYPGNFEGWAFESDYWDGFDVEPHILKKVVRQDDPEYIGNLNLARNGDESCIPYFNEHSVSDRKYAPKDALFLCSNNRLASNINTESVSELSGKKYTYQASATGKVNKGDRAADDKITLCAGARSSTTPRVNMSTARRARS